MDRQAIRVGLPAQRQLQAYRIWDAYFTPAHSAPGADGLSRFEIDMERSLPAIRLGCIQRLCYFAHVGLGTTADGSFEELVRQRPEVVLKPLRRWPDLLLGMIQLNPHDVAGSLAAIERWVARGPMLGAYFPGGGPAALACSHRNYLPLVERLEQLSAIIMQHTWFKTGGKQGPGESTPAELAELAARFPGQQFVCAHAGGEWQRGICAVRGQPNILVETSGFDPTAGFIEMAVRELGSARIIFGSHLPSRSLGTELGKILGADISDLQRAEILGANFRRLVAARQAAAGRSPDCAGNGLP